MDAGNFLKNTFRSAGLLCIAALAQHAVAQEFMVDSGGLRQWICQQGVGQDGVWFMRCDDLTSMIEEDPAIRDDASTGNTKFIPLWGVPFEDGRSAELARAVLCRDQNACGVVVASR